MINNNLIKLLTSPKIIIEKDLCKILIFKPGDFLFMEEEKISGFFLIKTGKVDITKNIDENDKIKLFTLTSGNILGEIALSKIDKYNTSAEVVEKTIAVFYEIEKIKKFLNNNIELSLPIYIEIAKIMSDRQRQINNNFKDFFLWSLRSMNKENKENALGTQL